MKRIRVWDWPVRVGHWLLVMAFVVAWLTSESETFRLFHVLAGGTVVGVVLFRLLWGLIGTSHARFSDFMRGPTAVFDFLRRLASGNPPHFTGHNPAGGWAIMALLVLALASGATGWLVYQDIGGDWLEEAHEMAASAMLGVAAFHLSGVIVGSLLHRENLVRAMLSGVKLGDPHEAIASARAWVLIPMLAWVAACAFWITR